MKSLLWTLPLALALLGCSHKADASKEASLDELNRAFSVMAMAGGRSPLELKDLTNFPSLRGKNLPQAPAGKKLVINRMLQKLEFVDQ